jgi:hypothetical protein
MRAQEVDPRLEVGALLCAGYLTTQVFLLDC